MYQNNQTAEMIRSEILAGNLEIFLTGELILGSKLLMQNAFFRQVNLFRAVNLLGTREYINIIFTDLLIYRPNMTKTIQ